MNNKEENLKESIIKNTFNYFEGIKNFDEIKLIAEVIFQKFEDRICPESKSDHDSLLLDSLVEGKPYYKCKCESPD
ncbi:MAG: hypothetical protein AM1032_000307 [Mycoplasmataceae bacterium]|nr:MAG: hypothetical protein AM1032_000307 [Mycoplasmataceae bacterium]